MGSGQSAQFDGSRLSGCIRCILGEGNVTQKRSPVELDQFDRVLDRIQRRRCRNDRIAKSARILSNQLQRERAERAVELEQCRLA